MSKILAVLVTKLAEGDFGAWPQRAYWWSAGKKTYMGAAFAAAWAVLAHLQARGVCAAQGWDCSGWSDRLATVAGVLMALGLYDGALRAPAPATPVAGGPLPGGRWPMVVLLLAVLALPACASAQMRVGREARPVAPDPDVVETMVCRGATEEAMRYVELRGGTLAERVESVERARKAVRGRPGCCAAEGKCAEGR